MKMDEPNLPTEAEVERLQSSGELLFKLAVTNLVIKEARAEGDARWKNVIPLQRMINERLVAALARERRERGEPDPPATHVVLDTANVSARATNMNRPKEG